MRLYTRLNQSKTLISLTTSQQTKDKLLLIILLLHLVVVLSYSLITNHPHAFWPGIIAMAISLLAYRLRPGTLLSRGVIGLSLVIFSAILIHLSGGLVEMHFHIFAALVLLSIYYDWRLIVLAAGFVALHHLVGLITPIYDVYAPNPNLVIYSLHIIFVVLESAVLCYQCEISRYRIRLINRQNSELKQTIESLEAKRQFGQTVSTRLITATSYLNATASQQASGSQEQFSALTESIEFLKELTETARNVANRTRNIDGLAQGVLASTQAIKATAETVAQTGEQGRQKVEQAVNSSQQVNNLYTRLVQTLGELEQRSNQMKSIISLLNSIGDETHLLALNAAIEAAGAGEQGARFGVIAQEVKSLSDRSVAASREVSNILTEVEEGIKQAASVVQDGQYSTQIAVKVAEESGTAISKLAVAVVESAHEVGKIALAVQTMCELTREISCATNQQFSASQQSVEKLREVGTIAQQTANGSHLLNTTAHSLETLSHELNQALLV